MLSGNIQQLASSGKKRKRISRRAGLTQCTTGVFAIQESTPEFLQQQIDAVFEDIRPDAVKIGMVASAELIAVIADRLQYHRAKNIVVDPVMVATSGSLREF